MSGWSDVTGLSQVETSGLTGRLLALLAQYPLVLRLNAD